MALQVIPTKDQLRELLGAFWPVNGDYTPLIGALDHAGIDRLARPEQFPLEGLLTLGERQHGRRVSLGELTVLSPMLGIIDNAPNLIGTKRVFRGFWFRSQTEGLGLPLRIRSLSSEEDFVLLYEPRFGVLPLEVLVSRRGRRRWYGIEQQVAEPIFAIGSEVMANAS